VLQQLFRHDEAIAGYRRALAIDTGSAATWNHLGVAFLAAGLAEDAERCFRRALALQPAFPEAVANLGVALNALQRFDEALACHDQVLAAKPRNPDALLHRAMTLQGLHRYEDAVASCQAALAIDPRNAEALRSLGNAFRKAGRLADAEASYRHSLELKPDFAVAHSILIFTRDLREGSTAAEQQAERARWYALHGAAHARSIPRHENVPDPGRKLRIGYVSADFRLQSAYYAFAPVICGHDRSRFEVLCYSGTWREDAATARLRAAADAWRSTIGVSDAALAEQVRRDRIDILVDLTAHQTNGRLLAFARKPAPVQVTAWGYAAGTGMRTMDYLLADPVLVPPGERALYAEQVIDLPCCICYEPAEYLPEASPLPALNGRPFTFGCINRVEKISDPVMALWGRVLAAHPASRLLVKGQGLGDAASNERFLHRLEAAGIARSRVRLAEVTSHAEHFRIYSEVDMILDSYPHGGGISTADALWMGVPVVNLAGATPVSRVSAAILSAVQMRDWIAETEDDYVRIAVDAAKDLQRLAAIRQGLRARASASPIGDLQAYTRSVEESYRGMWRRWCAGPR
jgi:predicted O-linked N-acetylglucosamine transferase (SPINDLY family)